jgi:hypothetical protein
MEFRGGLELEILDTALQASGGGNSIKQTDVRWRGIDEG